MKTNEIHALKDILMEEKNIIRFYYFVLYPHSNFSIIFQKLSHGKLNVFYTLQIEFGTPVYVHTQTYICALKRIET